MNAKRKFSSAFKTTIIICCLIGILSNILTTSSIPTILSFYTLQSNIVVLTFYFLCKVITLFKPDMEKSDIYYFFKGGTIMIILLTFFVYLVALSPTDFTMNFSTSTDKIFQVSNIFVHFINPILVLLDYIIFDEKGHMSTRYPWRWIMFPIMYIIYVYTYSFNGGTFFGTGGSRKYAYFFLDLDKIGVIGVAKYLLIIALVYTMISYILVLLDKLLGRLKSSRTLQK